MKKSYETQNAMVAFLLEIGLWEDSRRRFVLPAGPHFLSSQDVETVNCLGPAIVGFAKIADEAMHEAVDKNLCNDGMGLFRRAATAGIPRFRVGYQQKLSEIASSTTKVDLVRGIDGKLHVVEIDTTNTHGLGYGKILKSLEYLHNAEHQGFVGTEAVLNHSPLSVIVPFRDRFHEGEWYSTANLIDTLTFHREIESVSSDFQGKTVLDIHHRLEKSFQHELVAMAEAGELKLLVPPKDKLGTKNMLPLIWNKQAGEILKEKGLTAESFEILHKHVPESLFASKRMSWEKFSDADWLAKEVVSNAMKGVSAPSTINTNKIGEFQFILQRRISQCKQAFKFFGENGTEEAELFSRYVVYFDQGGWPLNVFTRQQMKN